MGYFFFSVGWVAGIWTCVGIAQYMSWKYQNRAVCDFCHENYKWKDSTSKYKSLYCSQACSESDMASDFIKKGYTPEQVRRMTGVQPGGRA